MIENNSIKCVNTHKEELHVYTIGNTKFIVRVINKNQNPDSVLKRLKKIVINHIHTKN